MDPTLQEWFENEIHQKSGLKINKGLDVFNFKITTTYFQIIFSFQKLLNITLVRMNNAFLS